MKKIWDKKSMLNFSRQAYNEKVTDCHALFRILRFFELGCFLGRNIDLGESVQNCPKVPQVSRNIQNYVSNLSELF